MIDEPHAGLYPASPGWGLTDEERRERDRLAEQAVACYRSKGTPPRHGLQRRAAKARR